MVINMNWKDILKTDEEFEKLFGRGKPQQFQENNINFISQEALDHYKASKDEWPDLTNYLQNRQKTDPRLLNIGSIGEAIDALAKEKQQPNLADTLLSNTPKKERPWGPPSQTAPDYGAGIKRPKGGPSL
jgi:hypothetical protein